MAEEEVPPVPEGDPAALTASDLVTIIAEKIDRHYDTEHGADIHVTVIDRTPSGVAILDVVTDSNQEHVARFRVHVFDIPDAS